MSSDSPNGRFHEDPVRFREALVHTEAETGFAARAIEKDYYSSLLLADFLPLFQKGFVFKGGTCLSKVYIDFFRLSEDLDFAFSMRQASRRVERREAIRPVKFHLEELGRRLPFVQSSKEPSARNESRQYDGELSYVSAATGERETLKLEFSLREEIIRPAEFLPARTILRDPYTGRPAMDPVSVRTLDPLEAFAEKIRAALTRRTPAVRDFFDVSHMVRRGLLRLEDTRLRDLVNKKLSIDPHIRPDLSPERLDALRRGLKPELYPVLRSGDYDDFDLDEAVSFLRALILDS